MEEYSGKRWGGKKTRSVVSPLGLDIKDALERNLWLLCSWDAEGGVRSA